MDDLTTYAAAGYRKGGALGEPEPCDEAGAPAAVVAVYEDPSGLVMGVLDVLMVDEQDPGPAGSLGWSAIRHWRPAAAGEDMPAVPSPEPPPEPTPDPAPAWHAGPPSEPEAFALRGRRFIAEVRTPRGPEWIVAVFGTPGDYDAHELAEIVRWMPLEQ